MPALRPLAFLLPALLAALPSPAHPADPAAGPAPGCLLVPHGQLGPAGQVPIRVETVASGLEVPWGLAFLPDGDVLVTERPGRLRLLHAGRLVEEPVARVPVSRRSEDGLLGIALSPDFARSRRFFLYATVDGPQGRPVNRIASWLLGPDARSAREERVLLDGLPAASYHDGGRLRLGPDGLLYAGTGDAGDPPSAARRQALSGKVLRLRPDGGVPADNPFPGSPVFLLGLRNVEAFDWRPDGALLVADHGPSGELSRRGHDRVLVARAGADLGWPEVYGCGARPGAPAPAMAWEDAVPPGGAAFYQGDAVPAWRGSLLVASLGARHLHRIVLQGDRVRHHEVYLAGDPPAGLGRLREVVTGPDGAVWVTTSNCDGRGTCPPEKDRIVRLLQAPR